MRFALLFLIALSLFPSCTHPLTTAELSQRPVIGALDIPLGTVIEITATLITNERSNSFYLLRVTQIAGHPLNPSQVLPFTVDTSDLGIPDNEITIAHDAFGLYARKTGMTIGTLDETQIAALNKEFVGKTYHLTVYEEAKLSGFPKNPPPRLSIAQGSHTFACTTSLVVLGQRP